MKITARKCILFGVFALALSFDFAASSNILFISFFSTKSHKITYMHLVEELAKRGHNVTVVSPVKPLKEIPNVKEIFTFDIDKVLNSHNFNPFESKEKNERININQIFGMMLDSCSNSLDLPQVRDLMKEKYDLVIMQAMFNDCILGLVHRLNTSLILFNTMATPSQLASKLGGHFPYSTEPNMLMGYDTEMNFKQRFLNYGTTLLAETVKYFMYARKIEQIIREKLGDDIPPLSELYSNASLILSNSHFSLTGPKPYLPDIIDVGGIHSRPAKPLPKDLEDFIKKGKDGFILFSMGSAIKGDKMPESKRKMILNVFSKLKQQVIWKWESETMPDLPKNVKLSKWLPQQDLLGHKDIKMFITHCGGGSTEESIYHGVPIVGIPMAADQPKNAKEAKSKGFAVILDWNEMNEETFSGAIQEILNNSKYRDNVKRLSTLFKDRPVDPLKLGVYWIEYVLRHQGAVHLRSASRKLNYFAYHSYDVIATYSTLIFATFYLIFALSRFIIRKTCCQNGKTVKNVSHSKKKN